MSAILEALTRGIHTSNAEETISIGEQLAKELPADACLALYGDLGVGKTTLVKGIARGLLIEKNMEVLKRRGQEYFTLVLTKNYSNLVAALSYCSDEGN